MAAKPLSESLSKLVEVWMNPGPHPEYHERVKADIFAAFPGLVRAVDDVVVSYTTGRTK